MEAEQSKVKQVSRSEEEDEDETTTAEEEEDEEDDKNQADSSYDPSKYDALEATPEIRKIFHFITFYSPQMIELSTKLRPFIPDYIPAVGDVDAFIKIPYPDPKMENNLGLTVLDEPNITQTDSALLQLKLKTLSRDVNRGTRTGSAGSAYGGGEGGGTTSMQDTVIASSGTAREIETWVENVKHLHETTARPESVTLMHTQTRPDIEELMQEWPEDFESALNVHSIPGADLDCSLEEYINIICGIFDIPVQTNKIASLHQLFSLYNEFQSSQHFKKYSESQI